jgi:hypothetical protein
MRDLDTVAGCGAPASVCQVRDLVVSRLAASGVNSCGLASAPGALSASLTWTFTASGCAQTLTLTVEKGFYYDTPLQTPFPAFPYRIQATKITLTYPFQWVFGGVLAFFSQGGPGPTTSLLNVTSVMQNDN